MKPVSKEEFLKMQAEDWKWAKALIQKQLEDPRPWCKNMTNRPIISIKQEIESSSELYGDLTAFYTKFQKGPYTQISYRQVCDDMNALGTALIARGLKDKRIGVVGENSYMWCISYLGVVNGTGVVVPLDKELNIKEMKSLIDRAEVTCVIFDSKREPMFRQMMDEGDTTLKMLVCKNRQEDSEDGIVLSWWKLLEEGRSLVAGGDRSFIDAQIDSREMAILLFTSGTTGTPKGVMLSHRNIVADLMVSPTMVDFTPDDIFFSVLPLHHTYECTSDFIMPLYKGGAIAHCEGLKYITKNLEEVHPTFFLGVPVLFETLYKRIWQGIRKQGKEATVRRLIRINRVTKKMGLDLSHVFFKQILAVLGGRMRMMIVGGAAINPEVLDGLMDFGIVAVQGYGLTEAAPMGALCPEAAPNSRSVGLHFPGFEVKILDPDDTGIGEICLKGDNIMLGYYEMPEETAAVMKDGWFCTGDLGYIDEAGYIYLTGRKKNVIITKNGKNVFPEELEYYLSNSDYVTEAMVWQDDTDVGDDTLIVASIFPNMETVRETLGAAAENPEEVKTLLWKEIDNVNRELAYYKKIKRLVVRQTDFVKTTGLKVIRHDSSNKLEG